VLNYYENPYDYPKGYPIGTLGVVLLLTSMINFLTGLFPSGFLSGFAEYIDKLGGIVEATISTIQYSWGAFSTVFIDGFDTLKQMFELYGSWKVFSYGNMLIEAYDNPNLSYGQVADQIVDDIREKFQLIMNVTYQSMEMLGHVTRTLIFILNFIRNLIPFL